MSLLQRVMFEAPWWSIAINAHFVPRRALHRAIAEVAADLRGRILDAGCGTQPYRRLLREASQVVGVDLSRTEGRRPDVLFDGHRLPFRDGSFDGVLCNQVLEHVFTPEQFLRELLRVLAPGGRLVLTVPFAWGEHSNRMMPRATPPSACATCSSARVSACGASASSSAAWPRWRRCWPIR